MPELKLKLKPLWLIIGYIMVVFVIYSSLDTAPIVLMTFDNSDKLLHITAYFGLMGWFLQIYHSKKMHFILACLFIAMGVSLEFLQGMGGVREFDIYDMLANASGVFIGLLLVKTPFPKILHVIESKVLV